MDSKVRQVHIRLNIRISTNNHSASGITLRVYRLQRSTVIRNDRAVQDKRGAAVVIYRSALRGSTVSDCAAVHGELPRVVDTASFQGPRTIPDCTAVHEECAVFSDIHAAAASALGGAADDGGVAIHLKFAAAFHVHTAASPLGTAAHDVAAVHGELSAAFHIHTAAVFGIATVDDAAVDGHRTAGAPLPQTVGVRSEFIRRCKITVLKCQVSAVCDLDNATAAGYFQHIPDEVQGNGVVNGQGGTDCNVAFQFDEIDGNIFQRGNKLGLCADAHRLRGDARCIC